MPKGENSDAPDRIWTKAGTTVSHRYWTLQDTHGTGTEYLLSTPARAAADQMLEALKKAVGRLGCTDPLAIGFERENQVRLEAEAAIAAAEGQENG